MMIRRLIGGTLIVGVVLVGLVAQAGSYLLALPATATQPPTDRTDVLPFAGMGTHAVGIGSIPAEDGPMPMTIWYPGLDQPTRASTTYSYGIKMLGPDTSTALATYAGEAQPGLDFDVAAGPFPLVILSHGFAITPSSYGWLAEHLASHGFVVVAPQHEESLDPGILWRSTIERPQDVVAALNFVSDEFDRVVDSERVAVVGHSYGGYTSLASAGARIDGARLKDICDDAYLANEPLVFLCDALLPNLGAISASTPSEPIADAVVSISGDAAMFGENGLGEIEVPVLAIGGTADTDSPFDWSTRLTYDGISSARKVEVALDGAGHMVFAGRCDRVRRVMSVVPMGFCSDPSWDRERAHGLVASYVTAFLLAELHEDHGASRQLSSLGANISGLRYRGEGY